MKKIKIKILEMKTNQYLANQYLGKDVEPCPYFNEGQEYMPCPYFNEGQEYIITNFDKPEGFCPWAWQDIFYMVHTLWNGGSFRNWYLKDGVVIGNCTDGIRPVTFLIERIAIENKT